MSVLGKRNRTAADATDSGEASEGNIETRARGGALEMALAADLEVAKEHIQ